MALAPDLLAILRCPHCMQTSRDRTAGQLDLVRDEMWLVCRDCAYKYPIKDDVAVMLIAEGKKWVGTRIEQLPDC